MVISLQKIDNKQRATTTAEQEEEHHDNHAINLLRFSAIVYYLYLALILVAGIYHVSYLGSGQNFRSGLLSIFVGALGIAEVTALLMFLFQLKRKVD